MIRVGIATASYPRDADDYAGRFVAEHAAWLRSRGASVAVVAAGSGRRTGAVVGQPDIADDVADGVADGVDERRDDVAEGVARVAGPGLFDRGGAPDALEAGPGPWLRVPGFCARYLAAVRRHLAGCDEVVGHWLVPGALAAALSAPRRRLTAIAHSGDVHLLARTRLVEPVARVLARVDARIAFVAEPLARRFAAALPGRRCRNLRTWLERRAFVAPMGIAPPLVSAPRPAAPAAPHVVFIGRLTPIKGPDLLVDAVASLPVAARVTVAGDGPLYARLAARADPRVRLVGSLSPAGVRDLLSTADLLVAPSRQLASGRGEGMPVAVREAMAAGVAVLASTSGGLAALPEGVAGRVRPGDVRELARGLASLIADTNRRERLARAGRAWVACQSWDHIGPLLTWFSSASAMPDFDTARQ